MTERLDHDALRELVPLLAAGMLGGPDRATVEAHLQTCRECLADYRVYAPIAGALAQAVQQVDPPPSLRAAVLAAARPNVRSVRAGAAWFAAAAMLVTCIGLGITVRSLQQRIRSLEAQLRDTQTPLAVLMAPDVRQINLAGQPSAPAASARVFWSRSRGLVLTAANLPILPPGRVYQLWFISGRTPVSAGLLSAPDERGRLTTTISTPLDIASPDALAVSLEPAGGVPQPTGSIYLIGQAH